MYKLLLFFGSLFVQLSLVAQSGYRFLPYGVTEGLSQNTVNAICTDHMGFVWIGTQDGLNRFDGERIQVWPFVDPQQSLGDNFILSITESNNGYLYLGCRNGLYRIDPDRNDVEEILLPQSTSYSNHRTVESMVVASNGVLFTLFSQLYFIDDSQVQPSTIEGFSNCTALGVLNGAPVIANDGQVVAFEDATLLYTAEEATSIRGIVDLSDGVALFYSNEVAILSADFQLRQRIRLPSAPTGVLENHDELWISTENGLFAWEDNTLLPIRSAQAVGSELERDFVRCMARDRTGGIWLGTNRFGCFRHDIRARFLTAVPGHRLADPIVWSVVKVGNELLVGTTRGVDVFLLEDGWDQPGYNPEKYMRHLQRIEGFHVSSMVARSDTVWVATRSGKLERLVKRDEQWRLTPSFNYSFGKALYHLTTAPNGDLMAIGANGGYHVSGSGRVNHFRWSDLSGKQLSDYAHHALVDGDGLWLSSMTGLHRFELSDSSFTFNGPSYERNTVRFPYTSMLVRARNGDLLVGTLGDGWVQFASDGSTLVRRMDASTGLPNAVIYSLVETDYGVLASSNAGLSCTTNDGLIHLTPQVGLPFDEHSINASGKIDGLPWFGGIDGLYFIHPASIQQKQALPRPVVTEMLVNYKPIANGFKDGILELNPGDNSLVFGVAVPGTYGIRPTVVYRMKGVADEWVPLRSTNERIVFTTLPGGEYTLEIATTGSGAVLQTSRFNLVVHPPFWETMWFFVLAVVFFVTVTFLIVRAYSRRKLREEVLKREAVERVKQERERISMDLHDNIGSQITHVITSLDNLSFRLERGEAATSIARVEELSDFARGTMNQLRDTIWTLSREEVSVDDFAKRINELASRLLADPDSPAFALQTSIAQNRLMAPELAVNLFRVIQEALNNALKHAHAKNLSAHVEGTNDYVAFTLTDDGSGFDATASEDSGYGLKNMERRISALKGQFTLTTAPGGGTRISVKVPLD